MTIANLFLPRVVRSISLDTSRVVCCTFQQEHYILQHVKGRAAYETDFCALDTEDTTPGTRNGENVDDTQMTIAYVPNLDRHDYSERPSRELETDSPVDAEPLLIEIGAHPQRICSDTRKSWP